MTIATAATSAALQVALLAGVPLLAYCLYHRWRHGRRFGEVARRAGLQVGEPRFILYSAGVALAIVLVLLIWTPPLEPLTRRGSAQHQFIGLGLGLTGVSIALLNGALQTALAEELVFRGLIAGSLARKLRLIWANLLQAVIFLLPHLAIIAIAPEVWPILPVVFTGALLFGWLRISSGSILGPWIIHAAGNVTIALLVAART